MASFQKSILRRRHINTCNVTIHRARHVREHLKMPKKTPKNARDASKSRTLAVHYLEEGLVDLHAAFHYHGDAFTADELEALQKIKKNVGILVKRMRRREKA